MTKPTATPTRKSRSKNTRTSRYFMLPLNSRTAVALVVIVILGIIPGWAFWLRSSPPSDDAAQVAGSRLLCKGELHSYENSFLGVGFCHPGEWGDVVVHEGKVEPTDLGSRWRLTLTGNSQITLGLVSKDWATTVPFVHGCDNPATQQIPAFAPVSTNWKLTGNPVVSAERGIDWREGEYSITEWVGDDATNGVCLRAAIHIGGTFQTLFASYHSEFSPVITSPNHHITTPTALISAADRAQFAAFVKTVKSL